LVDYLRKEREPVNVRRKKNNQESKETQSANVSRGEIKKKLERKSH
jgi:hypothetical protein